MSLHENGCINNMRSLHQLITLLGAVLVTSILRSYIFKLRQHFVWCLCQKIYKPEAICLQFMGLKSIFQHMTVTLCTYRLFDMDVLYMVNMIQLGDTGDLNANRKAFVCKCGIYWQILLMCERWQASFERHSNTAIPTEANVRYVSHYEAIRYMSRPGHQIWLTLSASQ